MAYKGRFNISNPLKYKGDPQRIIYRSLWERKFMVYCDINDAILEWGSEEYIIPYLSPWDGRMHRYFPDFYIKVQQANGTTKKFIIEGKPKKQCNPPNNQREKQRDGIRKQRHGGLIQQNGNMQKIGVTITVWNLRY